MDWQEMYVFFFQILCFLVLLFQTRDIRILLLCIGQLLYFKLIIFLYQHLYPDCSRIMMNHICFLLSIGFVMLARLSLEDAIRQFIIVVAASMVCLILPVMIRKLTFLSRLSWLYAVLGLAFLCTVFFIGVTHNGSTNWIRIAQISLQPSEFVKISFLFFLAAVLARRPGLPVMLLMMAFAVAHVLVLVAEKDLGGALLYFLLFIFLSYVASGRILWLLGGLLGGSLASLTAYLLFAHVQTRIQAWLDPWSDLANKGYQITQSLFAIGTGGWFGMGLTQGRPGDIPVASSDFIFSAIAEEFGLVFGIALLFVYLSIFIHFIMIAMDVEERFYKLLAYGISVSFIMQVFLSVGGVTRFIPSTGVTLPLISYGGSSVCSVLIIFAIMQGIFMIAYRTEEENDEDPYRNQDADSYQNQSEDPYRNQYEDSYRNRYENPDPVDEEDYEDR